MTFHVLTSSQRHMLDLVAEATFANPFEPRRYELDAQLAGVTNSEASPGHASRLQVAERVLHTVQELLYDVLEQGTLTCLDFEGRDRELVTYAALFSSFLRHEPDLTAHAIEQLSSPGEILPVKFARGALARLRGFGFDSEQSVRFFGLIYQISRAYHFISTTLPGKSASMESLRARLWQNVFTSDLQLYEFHLWNRLEDFSTFLLGETGTGKGTAARALGLSGWIPYHETGNHFAGNLSDLFIPINLSQFTESLIESELFGHEKGAFTGAIKPHDGVFARCHRHGTIFLDEIGEVGAPIQIKLLNVLQERAFMPVGSHKPARFYGRVIAATNQSIDELRHAGAFRDDFFYRLCSDIIVMPSLRQRIREDASELELLLDHIVARIAGEPMPRLVTRVLDVIHTRQGLDYGWAGNVRELEQCVRRVLITGDYHPMSQHADVRSQSALMTRRIERGDYTAQELLAEYCQRLYAELGSYESVGERLELDRRTVKKYITSLND
jgi:hypothetical protein